MDTMSNSLPDKATRHNAGKPQWSLIHWKSLEPMVRVLEDGALKYSRNNWMRGLDKKEIMDSLMRHATALMDGQRLDEETKRHHIGHLMCNAMFYSYFDQAWDTGEEAPNPGNTGGQAAESGRSGGIGA